MSIYSFDIKTAEDFLVKKVLLDHDAFMHDPLSASLALSSAMSSFHLIDWILNDSSLGHPYTDIGVLRTHLFARCSSLILMHDIANGGKHLALTRPKSGIKDTYLHKGTYSQEYSSEFDTSDLMLELTDGSKLVFQYELQKVINFWKDYFQNDLNINII